MKCVSGVLIELNVSRVYEWIIVLRWVVFDEFFLKRRNYTKLEVTLLKTPVCLRNSSPMNPPHVLGIPVDVTPHVLGIPVDVTLPPLRNSEMPPMAWVWIFSGTTHYARSSSNSPPFQCNVQIPPSPGTMHSQMPGGGECWSFELIGALTLHHSELDSLARNVSFQFLYITMANLREFTSSTQLINPKFCVSRPHRRSTTVSLETDPLVCLSIKCRLRSIKRVPWSGFHLVWLTLYSRENASNSLPNDEKNTRKNNVWIYWGLDKGLAKVGNIVAEVLFPLMFPGWLNKLAGSIRVFASYRDKPENIASYITSQANCNACKHLSRATLGTSRKLMFPWWPNCETFVLKATFASEKQECIWPYFSCD